MSWIATTQFYLYGKKFCTQTGYQAAKSLRDKLGTYDIVADSSVQYPEKIYMVTGANAGIGKSITHRLAKQGSTIYMICRSPGRAEKAQQEIISESGNDKIHVIIADCGLETDIRRMWDDFVQATGGTRLDGLICNAGVLLNEATPTKEGVETTFACHLLMGTYLLTELAIPTLAKTKDSRVVVVSSGGMYNVKFPDFNVATSRVGKYSGNLSYAYAKRGQVLLCEEWTKTHKGITFVTCHPGWAHTEAVEAAYGDSKKYLEPMRTPDEGADGIIWLCMTPTSDIQSGGFYLDRQPCRKHLGGAFFTDGSITKNSPEEVKTMMMKLKQWSKKETRPDPMPLGEKSPFNSDAVCSETPINIKNFMGKWHVWAVIPTMFEPIGLKNSVEKYTWNEKKECVDVEFSFYKPGSKKLSYIYQRGTMDNKENTRWNLKANVIGSLYVTVPMKYLLHHAEIVTSTNDDGKEEEYQECIVGVPTRDYVWIMSRTPKIDQEKLDKYYKMCDNLGYDTSKLIQPEFDESL